MLKLTDITINLNGKSLINGLSLDLKRGETVCLCGKSGCGKSTLLKSILGFIPFKGEIEVDGMVYTSQNASQVRRLVSYMPQDISLPHERVNDLLESLFSIRANRQQKPDTETLFNEWEQLNISRDFLNKPMSEISGGERQRIVLSLCALTGKHLMLLDEPTSSLDPSSTRLVADYLTRIKKKRDIAILAVSHQTDFAERCDRTLSYPFNQ